MEFRSVNCEIAQWLVQQSKPNVKLKSSDGKEFKAWSILMCFHSTKFEVS